MLVSLLFLFVLFKLTGQYHVYDAATDTLTVYYSKSTTGNCLGNGTLMNKTIKSGGILQATTTTSDGISQAETTTETTATSITTTTVGPTVTPVNMSTLVCPDDSWTIASRTTYNWCWQVFFENCTAWEDAFVGCASQTVLLSGFQSDNERISVAAKVNDWLTEQNLEWGLIWIAMKRTAACTSSNTGICGTGGGFVWLDGYTNFPTANTTSWWIDGQPDNLQDDQSVVVMRVYSNASNDASGKLDDTTITLNSTEDGPNIVGYVCGQVATTAP